MAAWHDHDRPPAAAPGQRDDTDGGSCDDRSVPAVRRRVPALAHHLWSQLQEYRAGSLSVIETLPGPLNLLADEYSLVSEVLQCLFGGRHLLAA